MRNLIAVSACLKRCSLAISRDGELYEVNENVDAAENLVLLADSLIKSNNIDLRSIEGVTVTSGPGSFTGIRAAQSFAKGLALALGIPAVGISYFDVLEDMYEGTHRDNLLVVIRNDGSTVCCQIRGRRGIASPADLAEKIGEQVVLIGDAIAEVLPHLKDRVIETVYLPDFRRAGHLLRFAQRLRKGKTEIRPLYMVTPLVFVPSG
jgi:tRNA threonylcarbamoyl adenosine modification protein YeaZ